MSVCFCMCVCEGMAGIKLTEVGGPTMTGCDVKTIFEIISCKGQKSTSHSKI